MLTRVDELLDRPRGRPYQPIPYDALQADPDYLIVGQMGGWTGLYGPVLEAGFFREIAAYRDCRVHERVR